EDDPQMECSDFNDLHKLRGLRETARQLFATANRLNKKCRIAQAPRSFSERITDPNKRPQHITYKRFETSVMTDDVLKYVQSLQGIVIVRAGMGSGKSTGLLRPLMHSSERGISVAHRVSLIGGLWEMMTEGKG
ncbi:hypothetical protein PS028_23750, partial [Shigella sonnei]|nr:hypothetical protein [Shigella sonnei]